MSLFYLKKIKIQNMTQRPKMPQGVYFFIRYIGKKSTLPRKSNLKINRCTITENIYKQ